MSNERSNKKTNLTKISNNWKYYIKSNKSKTTKRILPIYKILFFSAIAIFVIVLFALQNFKINITGFETFKEGFKNIFKFNNKSHALNGGLSSETTNLWSDSFKLLYVSLKYAIVGSFIGFLLALFTSILSYEQATNKYSSKIIKYLILFLRALPELVFVGLFLNSYVGQLCLLLIYIWFTWLWLHKYFIEILENVDLESYYVSIRQGNSKFRAFWKEILPRVKNRFIALFLFSIEANMRWASILAILGVPGIGELIYYSSKNTMRFVELGIPVFVLMLSIMVLEIINVLMKKYVFETKTKNININQNEPKQKIYETYSKKSDWRKILIYIIFVVTIIFSIFVLTTTSYKMHNLAETKRLFKAFVNPNFSKLKWGSNLLNENPILMILQCFMFSVLVITIIGILSLGVIRITSLKLNNKYLALSMRIVNALIRLIPVVILFFIFNPIFESSVFLLILILGIHQTTTLSKHLVEAVDNLDNEIISNLRMQGYTNNQIFKKYVLPSIKADYFSLLIFYFEIVFRSSITYAVLADYSLALGDNIWDNLKIKKYNPEVALSYVWIATIAIMFINIIGDILNKYWVKKR